MLGVLSVVSPVACFACFRTSRDLLSFRGRTDKVCLCDILSKSMRHPFHEDLALKPRRVNPVLPGLSTVNPSERNRLNILSHAGDVTCWSIVSMKRSSGKGASHANRPASWRGNINCGSVVEASHSVGQAHDRLKQLATGGGLRL